MDRIEAFKTADGRVFESERAAIKHADDRYGAELLKHAKQLVALEKYTAVVAYLDEHAADFAAMAELKADRDTTHTVV